MGYLEALDDDVLLSVLTLLPAADILTLAATAASWSLHLSGVHEASDGGLAEKVAAERFSSEAARDAIEAACATIGSNDLCMAEQATRPLPPTGSPRPRPRPTLVTALVTLAGLRALASSAPLAEAARRAFALRSSWINTQGLSVASSVGTEIKMLLDVLFKAGVRRPKKGPGESTLAASDAVISTLLCSSSRAAVLRTTEQVVRELEQDLDNLVEERVSDKLQCEYEVVARRRSAVEFLRSRMDRTIDSRATSGEQSIEVRDAHESLDLAIRDLDETIAGYMREGYDLACPKLATVPVPYTHWWVCLGQPYSKGWVALRSSVGVRPLAAH